MRIQRVAPSLQVSTYQEVDLALINHLIPQYRGKEGSLIALLQEVQSVYTYLPQAAIEWINTTFHYPLSQIYAVATFYAQFKLAPTGKHTIKVCKGTACHVQNAQEVMKALTTYLQIQEGKTTLDGLFTLTSVSCLGCCSLAPAMMIDQLTFGKLTGNSAIHHLTPYQKDE